MRNFRYVGVVDMFTEAAALAAIEESCSEGGREREGSEFRLCI